MRREEEEFGNDSTSTYMTRTRTEQKAGQKEAKSRENYQAWFIDRDIRRRMFKTTPPQKPETDRVNLFEAKFFSVGIEPNQI